MTLTYYKDYQELFQNIAIYYDLSSRGISGTTVQNMATPGTNNGTLNGTGWTYTDADRFGIAKQTNNNWTDETKYISTPFVINYQNGTFALWIKPTSATASKITGNYYIPDASHVSDFVIGYSNDNRCSFNIQQSSSTQNIVAITNTISIGTWVLILCSWGTTHKQNIYVFSLTGLIDKAYNNNTYYSASQTKGLPIGLEYWQVYNAYGGIEYKDSHFYGNIGEVMIWKDRQLSETEIYQLWNLTRQKYLFPVLPGQRGVE